MSADATPTGQTSQPANPHPRAAATATSPLDSAAESKYTPITPCRIADTHSGGGIITHNATRAFQVTGNTGFSSQDGASAGCGIPPPQRRSH